MIMTNVAAPYPHALQPVQQRRLASHLAGMSRRRLYEIINILESMEVIARCGKPSYRWQGLAVLPAALARIRVRACCASLLLVLPLCSHESMACLCTAWPPRPAFTRTHIHLHQLYMH